MRLTKPAYKIVPCRQCGARVNIQCRERTQSHSERVTDAYKLLARAAGKKARAEQGDALREGYLREAHELCFRKITGNCGAFGGDKHHPLEEAIADLCVSAFHRGKASPRFSS